MADPPTAFFERAAGGEGDATFVPRPHARSPWSADMLHGRLLAGLAADAIEDSHRDEGLLPARLTVDLFKSPPMEPVRVVTERVRDGNRIRVVDALVTCENAGDVARATCVLLRQAEHPPGEVWTPAEWNAPPPDDLEGRPGRPAHMMEMRYVGERVMGTVGQKQVWLRDTSDLVEGTPLRPFARAAIASDFASPLANGGAGGLAFINADITLYLRREPLSDWIGMQVDSHLGEEGIAIATTTLYDTAGAIGYSSVCAVANQMRRRP